MSSKYWLTHASICDINPETESIEEELEGKRKEMLLKYREFFREMGVIKDNSVKNGVLKRDGGKEIPKKRRFHSMPHIGKSYGDTSYKILFLGESVGKSCKSYIECFRERSNHIRRPTNKHMRGTFLHATYLLQKNGGYYTGMDNEMWTNLRITKDDVNNVKKELGISWDDKDNPLARVALTNLYKFERVGSSKRSEAMKGFVDEDKEIKLLEKEIQILEPDLILIQGKDLIWKELKEKINSSSATIKAGYHPSYRGKQAYDFQHMKETYKD